MAAYYDDKKKKYVVSSDAGPAKEFAESPGMMDYAKEGLEDNNTRAQLEAVRARRARQSGS